MLCSIHVKNIALLDDVEINLSDGLNILTGETGAGKSIIIDSVNFALGCRMNADMVRDDSDYALSELVFSIDDDRTRKALEDLDVMLTDDQVILQRRIIKGKSSCKVNGETVPASQIRAIAEHLIDIHGQHEHQSLLYRKNHRIMLDSFCDDSLADELCKLEKLYGDYKRIEEEYEQAVRNKDSAAADLDYSQFVVNEIEAAALKDGEDIELEDEFKRMNNSRSIAQMLGEVVSVLSSDQGCVSSMMSHALSQMRRISDMDPKAADIYEQLSSADDILAGCIRSLSDYEESLEFSPEDYEKITQRLDVINSLKLKYGQSIEAIRQKLEEETEKAAKLSDYGSYLEELERQKEECHAGLIRICRTVSAIRQKEAKILAGEIVSALGGLNFLDARFDIVITSDEDKITGSGFDDVEFMISTNPGEQLKPLTSVASGGELSRIMLALKSVLAKRDSIGTLIFDEIDSGISGKTAQLVADRMADIAAGRQVIAITHLPQIASHADTHFLIEKTSDGVHTSTLVRELSDDESVEELARMLAGSEITDAVRKNAAELKRSYDRTDKGNRV